MTKLARAQIVLLFLSVVLAHSVEVRASCNHGGVLFMCMYGLLICWGWGWGKQLCCCGQCHCSPNQRARWSLIACSWEGRGIVSGFACHSHVPHARVWVSDTLFSCSVQIHCLCCVFIADHQKLEREARICRLLKHPNIGKFSCTYECGSSFCDSAANVATLMPNFDGHPTDTSASLRERLQTSDKIKSAERHPHTLCSEIRTVHHSCAEGLLGSWSPIRICRQTSTRSPEFARVRI